MPRPPGLPVNATDGWFANIEGICVVFYRLAGRLWLLVDDRRFDLDGEASVDWRRDGSMAVFTVSGEAGQVILRYRPGPWSGPPLSEDPTPFVEDEDWDLGLFIANILFDEERSGLMRNAPS
ncbi:MAG: hypothetical protein ACT4OX_06235 [Actinomycetota bacterium]